MLGNVLQPAGRLEIKEGESRGEHDRARPNTGRHPSLGEVGEGRCSAKIGDQISDEIHGKRGQTKSGKLQKLSSML